MERRRRIRALLVALGIAACGLFVENAASAKTAASQAPAKSYVVKQGDGGWFQVARAHRTTMQKLMAANHANAGTPIKAGQRIKLPADAKAPKSAKAARTASTTAAGKTPAR